MTADLHVDGSVAVTTPDGEVGEAEFDSGEWAQPIGAPVSGVVEFGVTARDRAGNEAVMSLALDMVAMPESDETVARPTTLELQAPLRRFAGERVGHRARL